MTAPLLVAIAGGTGSGKTTLAQRLVSSLGAGVALIEHDWYYKDRSGLSNEARQQVNYDEPAALDNDLLTEHLGELRAGRAVDAPQYDFSTHTRHRAWRRVEPAPVIVVEGILLLSIDTLASLFDLCIFVETAADIRLLRRLRRDVLERGRTLADVEEQYLRTVRPMHLLHVEPSRARAHLIVPEGGENDAAVDVIVGRLRYLLV